MKIFTVAVSLIIVTIILISINFCVTKHAAEELSLALDKITYDSLSDTLENFNSVWKSKKPYFDLTMHSEKYENISLGLKLLYASIESQSKNEFQLGIIIIRSTIEEMLRFSSFDMSNIL